MRYATIVPLLISYFILYYGVPLFAWTQFVGNVSLKIRKFAGEEDTPIGAMPGCYRLGWRHGLLEEVT